MLLSNPLSDKYPSLSPYMYCAGNPVILVDPDGMRIHFVGTEAKQSFMYLLSGFNGINSENVYRAFGIISDENNVFVGVGLNRREFKKNYFSETGEKLKGKSFRDAYHIHRAISSEEIIELAIITSPEASFTFQAGDEGTRLVDKLEGFKPSNNQNPEWVNVFSKIGFEEGLFNEAFDNSTGVNQGLNWKQFEFQTHNPTGLENNHKGTILINGNRSNSQIDRAKSILESIKSSALKCLSCDF
jgi:hypothetical protein